MALETTKELCSVRRDVFRHVGNKWNVLVMMLLRDGPRRYAEMLHGCRVTPRMLTLTLRELQRDGFVVRAGENAYALSEPGRSLCSIATTLVNWADDHHGHIVDSRERFVSEN